jgi:hypothetical protein
MSKKEAITSTEETIASTEETADNYKVGYRKPPKHTRFPKGVSGNPKGRPKRVLDFDQEFLREAKSLITINEGGCRRRVPKHLAVIKQMVNNAIKGTASGQRIYRDAYREASEKTALLEAERVKDLERYNDVKNLTTEELERILSDFLAEKDRGK